MMEMIGNNSDGTQNRIILFYVVLMLHLILLVVVLHALLSDIIG